MPLKIQNIVIPTGDRWAFHFVGLLLVFMRWWQTRAATRGVESFVPQKSFPSAHFNKEGGGTKQSVQSMGGKKRAGPSSTDGGGGGGKGLGQGGKKKKTSERAAA